MEKKLKLGIRKRESFEHTTKKVGGKKSEA